MDTRSLAPLFNRDPHAHKYDFGHVLVVGGSPGMVGAPLLAGKATLRVGAGLVTIASAAPVVTALERRVEEIMTFTIVPGADAIRALQSYIAERHVTTLVIGNGYGTSHDSSEFVRDLLEATALPAVIDGGGLAALTDREYVRMAARRRSLLLTPHGGEFARLFGKTIRPADARAAAERYARDTGATIVLKGHPSFVASPGHVTYENDTGNPGLATAGTGDVLAGMAGGLLAQGLNLFDAAAGAAYLHGLAGDLVATSQTEPGLIASDVIDYIPAALRRVRSGLDERVK